MKTKTICLIILLILIAVFSISAAYTEELYKELHLQAGFGPIANVSVSEVPSQSLEFMQGMPFDLEDIYVAANGTENGRIIAYWNMISNTNFTLRVSTSLLKYAGSDSSVTSGQDIPSLSYKLTFSYILGQQGQGSEQDVSGLFSMSNSMNGGAGSAENGTYNGQDSEGNYLFEFNLIEMNPAVSTYVGSVDGSIFFQLTEESTAIVSDDSLVPPGNYTAEVTIEIWSE